MAGDSREIELRAKGIVVVRPFRGSKAAMAVLIVVSGVGLGAAVAGAEMRTHGASHYDCSSSNAPSWCQPSTTVAAPPTTKPTTPTTKPTTTTTKPTTTTTKAVPKPTPTTTKPIPKPPTTTTTKPAPPIAPPPGSAPSAGAAAVTEPESPPTLPAPEPVVAESAPDRGTSAPAAPAAPRPTIPPFVPAPSRAPIGSLPGVGRFFADPTSIPFSMAVVIGLAGLATMGLVLRGTFGRRRTPMIPTDEGESLKFR